MSGAPPEPGQPRAIQVLTTEIADHTQPCAQTNTFPNRVSGLRGGAEGARGHSATPLIDTADVRDASLLRVTSVPCV